MSAITYWHGGQAGLRCGERVLPPSQTGAKNTLNQFGTGRVARKDRVYVTTDFAAAMMYAVGHPSRGHVYEVAPVGRLRDDPDCSVPGLSFECESAIVVAVRVPTKKEVRKVFRALGVR